MFPLYSLGLGGTGGSGCRRFRSGVSGDCAVPWASGGVRNVFGVAGGPDSAIHTIFYNGDDGDGVFSLICDRPNLDFGLQLLRVFYGHQQDPLRRLIRMGTNPLKCSSAKQLHWVGNMPK